jgi:hypothetical protein
MSQCFFCSLPILTGEPVNHHHVIYRSRGGTETAPAHRGCHVAHHSNSNDFREWGRIGGQITAITRRWSFNLKNVRDNPAFELDRQYYLALYAH